MNTFTRLFVGVAALVIVAGCAGIRSEIAVALPTLSDVAPVSGKTVFINHPIDHREFQVKPRATNIPSLDTSKAVNAEIKQRAVARKRNAHGKALSDVLLKEGSTVSDLMSASIAKAYSERGYRVLANAAEATPNTVMVQPTIKQFWSWFDPSFLGFNLTSEIETDLTVRQAGQEDTLNVYVRETMRFETEMDDPLWVEVINTALKRYVEDLKAKIN